MRREEESKSFDP